jgi:prepilin-type N-terminal cleavage/methylation domain-containing protein
MVYLCKKLYNLVPYYAGGVGVRRYSAYGFSLVELMLVVAIISIIVSIAVPTVVSARVEAQVQATKAMIRTIYTAEQIYYVRTGVYTSLSELTAQKLLDNRFGTEPMQENGYSISLVVQNGGVGFLCTAMPDNLNAPIMTVDEKGFIERH